MLAVVRKKHNDDFQNTLEKDLMELTKEDLAGADAIANAVSAWKPETFSIHTDGISHLHELIKGTDTKLLMMGGEIIFQITYIIYFYSTKYTLLSS